MEVLFISLPSNILRYMSRFYGLERVSDPRASVEIMFIIRDLRLLLVAVSSAVSSLVCFPLTKMDALLKPLQLCASFVTINYAIFARRRERP